MLTGKNKAKVIRITADVIAKSVRANSGHCMVAEAIRDAYPEAKVVMVDLATIRFSNPATGKRYTYFTPRKVQQELLRFDAGQDGIEPFDFILPKPAQVRAIGFSTQKKTPEQRAEAKRRALARAVAVRGDHPRSVVVKKGGDPMPIGPLSNSPRMSGQRREYGLRAMGRAV